MNARLALTALIALITVYLRLSLRERGAMLFGYAFTMGIFLFMVKMTGADKGGALPHLVSFTLVFGIVMGLMGAGVYPVQARETNILRRYRAAPLTPTPILVASMIASWLLYLPTVLSVFAVACLAFGMPMPRQPVSLFLYVSLAYMAFQALGLIVASVVNTSNEVALISQLLIMPMLFLSGVMVPLTMLPEWLQLVSQFIPSTHLHTGLQGIFSRGESLFQNWFSTLALLATLVVGLFTARQLFRWEKDERIRPARKLAAVLALCPFLFVGAYQASSRDTILKATRLSREQARTGTTLIRGARVFTGDGQVLEKAAVLVKNGRIDQVYEGEGPPPDSLRARVVESAGKTLLPGLIDTHVHAGFPGGVLDSAPSRKEDREAAEAARDPRKALGRALAAYLYSGVTAVRSSADDLDVSLEVRGRLERGERVGAELQLCGPIFAGGIAGMTSTPASGTAVPTMGAHLFRSPTTAAEGAEQAQELANRGVSALRARLASAPGGSGGLEPAVLKAIVDAARRRGLPVIAHTADARGIEAALAAGVSGVDYGPFQDPLPPALLQRMVRAGVTYNPALSSLEALVQLSEGKQDLLKGSLVQQIGPRVLLEGTAKALHGEEMKRVRTALGGMKPALEQAKANLLSAHRAGVPLVAGTGSGGFMHVHGPAIHRELRLWVEAGIPPKVALQAATRNAARFLHAEQRIGRIRPGFEATLLLMDGNPLKEISATERITGVMLKGEMLNRGRLLDQK